MVYISNIPPPLSLSLNSLNQSNGLFKVGQILNATIEQVQGKQVQLSIGNQTLMANSKEAIQNSGSVQLHVKQTQPSVVLSIIGTNKPSEASQTQQTLQNAYRQFMPQQTSVSQAFQQIGLLQSLPPALLTPINQLLEQMIKSGQPLTGKDLKNKLEQSGLFLESKLKNSEPPNAKQDVKAQLLTLKQQSDSLNVKTPMPQLLQLSSALTQAINRLTVQQLQLYENPLITPLELPFQANKRVNKNTIELRQNENTSPPSWEVLMDIDLPQGNLSSKLAMSPQGDINCFLWCETLSLENLIKKELQTLKQSFTDNELSLNTLQIVKQKPSSTKQTTKVAIIDIHI